MTRILNFRALRGWLFAGGIAAVTGAAGPVLAAPQILGVSASLDPVPMTCSDGVCTAELTTFCLQRARPSPDPGTRYEAMTAETFILHVGDGGAAVQSRPVGTDVRIESTRGFASIIVTLDERIVEAVGNGNVALAVAPGASVLPVAAADDPDPLSAAEIAYATGPLRALAERVERTEQRRTVAAQVTNRVINTLPSARRLSAARQAALWDDVRSGSRLPSDHPGVERAHDIYGACASLTGQGSTFFLKRCLQARHDDLVHTVNQRYWDRAAAGF